MFFASRMSQRPGRRLQVERLEDRTTPSAGALDPTFGSGGKVLTDFPGSNDDLGFAVAATQPDGKVVMVGGTQSAALGGGDFALARYNADGSPDTGFGAGGEVTTDFGNSSDQARAVAVQADGKIVVGGVTSLSGGGGDFALARYNSDGTLDVSFGTGGKMTTNFGFVATPFGTVPTYDTATGLAIQGDGKIVLVGQSDYFDPFSNTDANNLEMARYNSDGTPDVSFGSGGQVVTDLGATNLIAAEAVGLQADGKIVVTQGPILARFNAGGSLDAGFGVGGAVTTVLASRALALQGDGGIVLAGTPSNFGVGFTLARYTSAGTLDTGFGVGGTLTTSFGGDSAAANAVAVQPDGKIVAAGFTGSYFTSHSSFALARYNPNGSPDTTFATGGKTTTDFGNAGQEAWGVALQADGKIVAGGTTFPSFGAPSGTGDDFALARYNPDGSLDAGFGAGGKATTDFTGPRNDGAQQLAVQADGKILVVGDSYSGTQVGGLLVRYNADGTLDTGFGAGGKVSTGLFAKNVAVQGDGKILVSGSLFADFALARFNADGSRDTTFGIGGIARADMGGSEDAARLALQVDGKIVLAASSHHWDTSLAYWAVARFNGNGTPDAGFGTGGKVLTLLSTMTEYGNELEAVLVQPDGKIVTVGGSERTSVGGQDVDFAVVRYNGNGTPDGGFGTGGVVLTDLGRLRQSIPHLGHFVLSYDVASAVALQADGKLVVAGTSLQANGNNPLQANGNPHSPNRDVAVVRYNSDGSVDQQFGASGKVFTDFAGGDDDALGVVVQPTGKIVVVGGAGSIAAPTAFALARYTGAGALDESFGTGGKVTTSFGGTFGDFAQGIALQADGKLVVAGSSFQAATGQDFALARYEGLGAVDVALQQITATILPGLQSLIATGTLTNGQGVSLLAALQAALQQLEHNNVPPAIQNLEAFVAHVEDFLHHGVFTSAQAQPLVDESALVIDTLGSGL
jgi:uncharacterized delta-60 repeat protein